MDNLFTTPRKLIQSLQDPNDFNSDYSEEQSRRFRSPCSEKFGRSPTTNHNSFQRGMIYEVNGNGHIYNDGEEIQDASESVSSTEDNPVEVDVQEESQEAVPMNKTETQVLHNDKAHKKKASIMFFGIFFIIVAVLTSLLWTEVHDDESFYVVPT